MSEESLASELAYELYELSGSLKQLYDRMCGYRIFEDYPTHIRFHGYDLQQRLAADPITGDTGLRGHMKAVGGYDHFEIEFLFCSGEVPAKDYVEFTLTNSSSSIEKAVFEYDTESDTWSPQSPRQMTLQRCKDARHWVDEAYDIQNGQILSRGQIGYFMEPFN